MNQEKAPHLIEHEIRVLRLVAQGLTNKQITCDLGIKERTVEYHLGGIFQRLDVTSRTAAAMTAQKLRLLDV